ncbi:MAG: DUF4910 domain-containing protein [Candidatus Thorarchaeota archaeon]
MKDLIKFTENVLNEVSGKKAKDWVAEISQYNRLRGTQEYHEIVQRIIDELETYGFDEIKLHKYHADGKTKIWEYTTTRCWEVKSGELWLIEPKKEILCRTSEVPMCVVGYSKNCDLIADLIDVGEGISDADFKGKDVEGKVVLMQSPRLALPPFYASKGAKGVILYPNPLRAEGYRDMTVYTRFQADEKALEKSTFGFSIPHEKAIYLKNLLKEGSVKIQAKINARLFEGDVEVISAAILGKDIPQEEIIITAHLCHPKAGANDNASGSAGLIELARSLTFLIKNKIVRPPKRTIRFLWVPEFEGTWPWAKENEEKVKSAICNINLDMIGEHPINIGEPFEICQAPYSRPSIVNDLLRHFTEIIADHPKGIAVNGTKVPMRYRILPFCGGSDQQVFVDKPIAIPGTMLGHSDPLWHSSLDIIENVDSTELQRVVGIALCTSYILATLDKENLIDIWPIIEQGFYSRLGDVKIVLMNLYNELNYYSNSIDKKVPKDEKAILGLTILAAVLYHEKHILTWIKKFNPSEDFRNEFIVIKENEIDQWYEKQTNLWKNLCKKNTINLDNINNSSYLKVKWSLCLEGLKNFSALIPLYFSKEFQKIKVDTPFDYWMGDLHEIFNFVDLSFNLAMICAMLSIEYKHLFYPSEVQEYMKLLETQDFIKKIED